MGGKNMKPKNIQETTGEKTILNLFDWCMRLFAGYWAAFLTLLLFLLFGGAMACIGFLLWCLLF